MNDEYITTVKTLYTCRYSGSRAFIPVGKYSHSLSLLLRLAPPNVYTLCLRSMSNGYVKRDQVFSFKDG